MRFLASTLFAIAIVAGTATSAAAAEDLIDADRPGIADSASVIDPGVVQLEWGFQNDAVHGDAGTEHQDSWPLLLRYGLTKKLELRVESDTFVRDRGESGFGPVTLGFKSQLVDGGDDARIQDFGFIGGVTVPSGSGIAKQSKASAEVVAAGDVRLGEKWSVNPNVGGALYHDESGDSHVAPSAAVTLEYEATERLHPGVEIARVPPDEGESNGRTLANAQLAWIVRPSTQLDIEAGRDLEDSRSGYVTAGVSVRFR